MTNLTGTPSWDSVVELEVTTQALGGPGGPMNSQAQALLNRTEYLANQVANISTTAVETVSATANMTIAATANATTNALLLSTTSKMFILQISSIITGSTAQNYDLTLYDGNPASGGILIYQAMNIQETSFIDNSSFFQPVLTTGQLYVQITNIDANAMTIAFSMLYINLI